MSFDLWRSLAINPPRAIEPPAGSARLRVQPEDFEVHEELGFAASGQGEHVLLQVRKRLANTAWVARELARAAGVRHFDVGYAGLKDRNAVTTQWFTVPSRRRDPASWLGTGGEGYEVIAATAHARKLPRGALAGNRFRIVLRDFVGDAAQLERRVAEIALAGVPNYFGPQRFGRDLGNLRGAFAEAAPDAVPLERGFELSALRSLLFNAVLAARVVRKDWCHLQVGERANLDGSNSSFVVQALDESIATRLAALDIHPTGPLYGRGESGVSGDIAALEAELIDRFPQAVARLERDRLEASRRPLRVAVRDLELSWLESDRTPVLSFRLRPGSFATTVLRELIDLSTAAGSEDEHD
ncbi:MAG: tRNA pseudouridine(13) synthase TruD [Gammaproteobacteria bacterium]